MAPSCPVCNIEYSRTVRDSPQNSDIPSECHCWLCVECWREQYHNQIDNCQVCGEDVSDWLYSHYETEDEDEEDEE